MYIFTVSEEVLFEVNQLRDCIEDECPEIEFEFDSADIPTDQLKDLSSKRSSVLDDLNRLTIK